MQHLHVKSNKLYIQTGVPQGSIPGPFLLLVYVNNFLLASNTFSTINYSDGIVLSSTVCAFTSNQNNAHSINGELSKGSNWLFDNKLSVNGVESKVMYFDSKDQSFKCPTFSLNNSVLER